uniref:non-specific serine/threonine protein kinase n=1 Tax=Nelumbo nucifera TaxID=4432 RepID=A0A822YEQ5_NELNU|nr:TPA_asm: hypothetical protein HUJ06_031449 [Nelumbo nucifera]
MVYALVLLSPFLLPFVTAQTFGNVTLGSSLTLDDKNSFWLSPSGEFAFGFSPLQETKLFLLAIWFHKIPEKTIVWYANGDKPAPLGSKVELKKDGHLQLRDPQGEEIWSANSISDGVIHGAMLDTGNFVLARNSSDNPLRNRLIFNESGSIFILRRNGSTFPLTPGNDKYPSNEFYYRATLDFDGVFTQYARPRTSAGNESWFSVWYVPDDILRNSGGNNGSRFEDLLPPSYLMRKKDQGTLIVVGSVLLGGSVFFNLLLLVAVALLFSFIYHSKVMKGSQVTSLLETNLRCFTYRDLEKATDGFKEELGRGAFGIVYKGVLLGSLSSSSNQVAVKRLDKVAAEGEQEFKNEVIAIGKTHHKNLVRLLGFCMEEQHRLLVYEFMSNGTLASFLFGISKPDRNRRVQIAFGIARGLVYLHEECITQIIHCDIKPQNILLDDCFTARISDFGLAKLLLSNQSLTQTAIRGTKGYVDVYSFGVILLEIICCRKSVKVEMEDSSEEKSILTDWAYDCYQQGRLDALVENDAEAMNDISRLERLVRIALWCIQEQPSLRPTMKKVTQMLEGIVEVSEPPCPYPFSSVC